MTASGRDLPVAEHLSSVAANVSEGGKPAVRQSHFERAESAHCGRTGPREGAWAKHRISPISALNYPIGSYRLQWLSARSRGAFGITPVSVGTRQSAPDCAPSPAV